EVSSEKLTDCLRELGLVLCKILSTYHAILRYHIEEDERLECGSQADEVTGQIQRSMRENLHTVCQSAVEKITVLLQRHDLTAFKFDNFLEIIGLANRFEKFGRRYFGNGCEAIASTIESQTASYFRRYHLDRLDELRMFLESEAWALCPVQSGFNVFELQEFGFLKRTNPEDDYDSPEDHEKVPDELNYELMPVDAHNPFEGVERLASELEVRMIVEGYAFSD
uniref:Spindle pole body component n=1 Tax=Plectus sambesii TaxID=2011161 RepID=A0A914VCF5_9BILA